MILLTILLAGLALFALLSTVSEMWSLMRLPFLQRRSTPEVALASFPSILILVPAHDEEVLILACLTSLGAQTIPHQHFSIVVVADNCSDRTAEIARGAGAQVLERNDPENRGKPRAIAWALKQIDLQGFDALIIVDADTEVAPDFLAQIVARGPLRDKVLQPFIGVQNSDENALTRMAAVHERVVHGIAYRTKDRVGLNVPLGVGMCLGTNVLERLGEWPALSLGEDIELYLILTEMGVRIEGVPTARIVAQEASSLQQSGPQRHRWTTGRIQVLRRYAPAFVMNRTIHPHQRLDIIAEVSSLGPVVHLGLATAGVLAASFLRPPGATLLIVLFSLSLVRIVIYTVLAIASDPHPGKAIRAFGYLPVYALWRNWLLMKSLVRPGGGEWHRTVRHSPTKKN